MRCGEVGLSRLAHNHGVLKYGLHRFESDHSLQRIVLKNIENTLRVRVVGLTHWAHNPTSGANWIIRSNRIPATKKIKITKCRKIVVIQLTVIYGSHTMREVTTATIGLSHLNF